LSPHDDVAADMRGSPIDDHAVESLLSGAMVPDDAPPGYREVAVLVRNAAPLPGAALPAEPHLVAAFAAEVRGAPHMSSPLPAAGGRRLVAKAYSAKAAALAAVIVFGGGVAAAAAGALPGSLQSTVASAASHVGLTLPDPGRPVVNPANLLGQCNAYASVSKGFTDFTNPALTNSTAFGRLEAAAAGKGESVQAYCASVGSTTTSTVAATTTTSTTTTVPTTTTAPGTTTTTTLPPNSFGQCNAYSSVSKGFTDFSSPALTHSTAFRRLAALAAAAGESVEAYCAPILGISTGSTTTTTTIASSHGNGKSHHGNPNGSGKSGRHHGN
jgi:hypothetical protein